MPSFGKKKMFNKKTRKSVNKKTQNGRGKKKLRKSSNKKKRSANKKFKFFGGQMDSSASENSPTPTLEILEQENSPVVIKGIAKCYMCLIKEEKEKKIYIIFNLEKTAPTNLSTFAFFQRTSPTTQVLKRLRSDVKIITGVADSRKGEEKAIFNDGVLNKYDGITTASSFTANCVYFILDSEKKQKYIRKQFYPNTEQPEGILDWDYSKMKASKISFDGTTSFADEENKVVPLSFYLNTKYAAPRCLAIDGGCDSISTKIIEYIEKKRNEAAAEDEQPAATEEQQAAETE